MTQELTITSCQAANTFDFMANVGQYLTRELGEKWGVSFRYIAVDESDEEGWNECYAMATAGKIDISWICAATYAQLMDQPDQRIDLLAAPQFCDPVYQDQPTYLSYLAVHVDSPYQSFADLAGSNFTYNETVSHSGHNIVCAHLHSLGIENGYFASAVASGGHVKSMHALANGDADCAAIDSSVWLWYQTERPDVCQKLRSVGLLGPYAAPPWIISRAVPNELAQEIRTLLLELHQTDHGTQLLRAGELSRFTTLDNAQYESALNAVHLGATVPLVRSS